MANRLENHFKSIMKTSFPHCYFRKLVVLPGVYNKAPADFLLYGRQYLTFIECKECEGTSIPHSKLTQVALMSKTAKEHNTVYSHQIAGYFLIRFWKGSKKNSAYYVINVGALNTMMVEGTKKSFNEADLDTYKYTYVQFLKLIQGMINGYENI